MESLLKWLDDCDDLLVVFRVQAPAVAVTACCSRQCSWPASAHCCCSGPPDLLAAP